MDTIEVTVLGSINGTTPFSLWNRCIRPQGGGQLPRVNLYTVLTKLEEVVVILEATTAHGPVELLRSPVGLGIQTIGGVTRADRRR